MTEYYRQAAALIELFELDDMTQDELIAWYNSHSDEFSAKLSGPRRNTFVLRALTRFTDDVHIENLYEAMLAISISDEEYVKEESELVKSAASIWGFTRPPFKVSR